MSTSITPNQINPNLSFGAGQPAATSTSADTAKAPGDAAHASVDQIIRSNAGTMTGNAVFAGLLTPSLLLGGFLVGTDAALYTISGHDPGIGKSLLLTGAMTTVLGVLRWGVGCGTRDAKAAIDAVSMAASNAISSAANTAAWATGASLVGLGAWNMAVATHAIAHPMYALAAGGTAALVGLVHSLKAVSKATNEAVAKVNG